MGVCLGRDLGGLARTAACTGRELTRRGTCLSRSGNLTTLSTLPTHSTTTVASIWKRAG